MASNEKIAAVVGMLCEAYNRKPSALTFKAYAIALADVDDATLDAAATRVLCGSGEFMPTPGQLLELCKTGGVTFEGRAEIAWHEFDRAVGTVGGDRSVTFADGVINATVRLLGGWILCCEKSGDDYFIWLQRQFKTTYARLCETGSAAELRWPLSGRLARANVGLPDHVLEKLKAYTGNVPVLIETTQPVIAPPTEPPPRIANRSADIPRLQLQDANKRTISETGPQ